MSTTRFLHQLPDTRIEMRKSARIYTHVVIGFGRLWHESEDREHVLQWSGTSESAVESFPKWLKCGYSNLRVELINGGDRGADQLDVQP